MAKTPKLKSKQPRKRIESLMGVSITCDLCNDAAWWPANGFSEAERQQICGPRDLNCPGFGGNDEGGA